MFNLVSLPLSPYSKVFYNEWKILPSRIDYNIVFDQNLLGEIDAAKMVESIKRFLIDYIIFNCHIREENNELYWVKNDELIDMEHINDAVTDEEILDYVKKPFDLEKGPLYRFRLIKIGNNECRLIIVLHHILIDGSSFDEFINEISHYYNNKDYKKKLTQDEQIIKISSLSRSLSEEIEKNQIKNEEFWQNSLLEFDSPNLNFIGPATDIDAGVNMETIEKKAKLSHAPEDVKQISFFFSKTVLNELAEIKELFGVSPYLYGKIIFAILIGKYTGQRRFCLSYPISIKEGKELFYGACINTNFIPFDFNKIDNLSDLISQTKNFIDSLDRINLKHNYLPVSQIITATSKSILGCIFSKTNFSSQTFNFNNVKAIVNDTNVNLHYDLSFEQEVREDTVYYRVKYNSKKVNIQILHGLIESYKELFITLLEKMLENKDNLELINTKYFSLLTKEQYQQVIYKWNKTEKEFPQDTIPGLFEAQVKKTPEKIAVIHQGRSITYKELNERANQLAHYLRTLGICRDTLVAVICERSWELIICMFGVLKAGGAYVPLDPKLPIKQIQFILDDSKTPVILTQESIIDDIPISIAQVIAIDEEWDVITKHSPENPINISPDHLAYAIYTSGTTGNPKGVLIEHKNVVNYIFNMKDYLSEDDNVDFSTNIAFDLTVTTTICSLCLGCKVIIYDGQLQDLFLYKEHLIKNKVTVIKSVPSYFELIINFLSESMINKIILGGEKLTQRIINNLYNSVTNSLSLIVYDEYGPTETTVGACISRIYPKKHATIGRPYFNYTAFVLDENLVPLPMGAIGELYIGGTGLARGYLNNPELTAEKFITNLFQNESEKKENKNAQLYKTGDLVRWLPEGNLEYIGRNDTQIKMRGYRLELEGIENILSGFNGIKQNVVLLHERGDISIGTGSKHLIAYYVSEEKLSEEDIAKYLKLRLPDYMIPSFFIFLDELPLTMNGKLDRKALPIPEFTNREQSTPPRNELEIKICKIWAEILDLPEENIGMQDDFFGLGGSSLLIVKIVSVLKKMFGIEAKVSEILINNTVEKLAQMVAIKR